MRGWKRAWALLATVGFSACTGDEAPVRAVGDGCYVASDCTAPLVCAYQRCHAQCTTTRDCGTGQRCVGSMYPKLGVCLLEDETNCERHSDCPSPLVCGRRSRCEAQCQTDRDCFAAQTCAQGSCVDTTEAPETPPATGQPGQTCTRNSDCDVPLVCNRLGFCATECVVDRDCLGGQVCVESVCRLPMTDAGIVDAADDVTVDTSTDGVVGIGKKCAYTSECPGSLVCRPSGVCDVECKSDVDCPTGSLCYAGSCVVGVRDASVVADTVVTDGAAEAGKPCFSNSECDDGKWCNGVERCSLGACAPSLEGPCDSHSSCVIDACDELTKTCMHTKIAGTDVDGDGQLDVVCGGTDCDDKDPLTYKGAPERCDGKDNSCNGLADEYAVLPRGAAALAGVVSHRNSGSTTIIPTGFVGFAFSDWWCGNSTTPKLMAQAFDATGKNLLAERNLHTADCNGATVLTSAAGTTTALAGIDDYHTRMVVLVKHDLAPVTKLTLAPDTGWSSGHLGDIDAAWTGSRYILGWNRFILTSGGGAYDEIGRYGFLKEDGTQDFRTVPTADSTGKLGGNYLVKVAFNDTGHLVAWTSAIGKVDFATLDLSGAVIAGPLSIGSGNVLGAAGTKAGFVVFWSDGTSKATFVTASGTLGKTLNVGFPILNGHGTYDGRGGAVAARASDGLHLLFVRGALDTGIENSIAYTPSSVGGDNGTVQMIGGQLGLGYWSQVEQRHVGVLAGCLP